jgi:hypothetical protein
MSALAGQGLLGVELTHLMPRLLGGICIIWQGLLSIAFVPSCW